LRQASVESYYILHLLLASFCTVIVLTTGVVVVELALLTVWFAQYKVGNLPTGIVGNNPEATEVIAEGTPSDVIYTGVLVLPTCDATNFYALNWYVSLLPGKIKFEIIWLIIYY